MVFSSFGPLGNSPSGTSRVVSDRPLNTCPAGSETLGRTFFEAGSVDLQDRDTARLVAPKVVDISPSGDHILVGDWEEYDVKIFDRRGILRSVIGARGQTAGSVYLMDGAAFRNDSSIYIADSGRMQLMEFNLTGTLVKETELSLRPITSVQVVDTTALIVGRSWPILDREDVRGVHLVDGNGNFRARIGRQPLASVAAVPGALAATAPFAALIGDDSVVVAWRLTNQVATIDLTTGGSRHFPIGGAPGYVDPDTVLRRLDAAEQVDILNRTSPLVDVFSVGRLILVGYFSPATDNKKLRYLIYRQSGEFVELIEDAPLVRGTYRDSLLVIGRSESTGNAGGYSLRMFALCPGESQVEGDWQNEEMKRGSVRTRW